MRVKCDYCRSFIDETEEFCPYCQAPNSKLKRNATGAPSTIEELKKWYIDHNLPPEDITRFFIGTNYTKPRAFGIYYDEDKKNFIVYKNKSDGSRAIRYEGKDETYAVNEIYLKLKDEIQNQKSRNKNNSKNKTNNFPVSPKLFIIHFILAFIVGFTTIPFNPIPGIFMFLSINPGIFIMLLIFALVKDNYKRAIIDKCWHIGSFIICFILIILFVVKPIISHRDDAYYKYNNEIYYDYGGNWYYYNSGSWESYTGSTENFEYLDDNYDSNFGATDFENSSYYESHDWSSGSSSSSSSDWDSGSSWSSSDSWDSGGSDWDSDW